MRERFKDVATARGWRRMPRQPATVVLAAVLAAAACGARGARLYDRKPVWWDTVQLAAFAAPTNLPPVERAMARVRAARRAVEDWRLIGPFDAPKGQGWDMVYPPEQKVDPRAVYSGVGGERIAWQKWDAGKPCPIPPKLANAVVFFYKAVTAPVATRTLLLVASDDRAAVWLNDRPVFRDEQRHLLAEDDPRLIPLELQQGLNTLLIKVEQTDGAWGMKAWWTPINPRYLIVRSLTDSFEGADEKGRLLIADRLFDAYARLDGEGGNALFWAAYGIVHRPEAEACRRLQDVYRRMEPTAKTNPDLAGFLEKIFSDSENPTLQRMAGEDYFAVLLQRQEYDALCAFVDRNPYTLAKALPVRYLYFKLEALYQKGDPEAAAACLDQIRRENSGIERDGTFQTWVNRVDSMRLVKAKPAVDLERDTTVDAARKLADEKNTAKLNQFLRETLDSKRGSVVAVADDPLLYRGSLAVYKEALGGYAAEYQPALQRYVDALASLGALGASEVSATAARLSLVAPRASPPAVPALPPAVRDVRLPPAEAAACRPLASLHPGCLEQSARVDPFTRTYAPYPRPGACRQGERVVFQSSRDVVGIEGGRVIWHTTFDNSRIAASGSLCPFLGSPTPAADERRVYARVAEKGQLGLVALDLADGRRVWSLPPKYAVASDPAVTGDSVLCVVRERDAIVRYLLLVLDKASGRVEDEIFLYSGPDTLRFWREFAERLELDLNMPAPVVDGALAYIETNAGLLFGVDLADRSIRWAREYLRPPFHSDRAASLRLGARRIGGPIVGERTLFVAPVDGSEVLLLDKLSGRRIAGDSRFAWRECRPLGRGRVLMLAAGVDQALIFSMDSLEPQKTLPGKEWEYLDPLADGALVAHDRQLFVLTENGQASGCPLPEGLRPLELAGGRCLGLSAAAPYPELAVGAAPAEAATTPDLRCAPGATVLANPELVRRGGGLFAVADNAVVAYDAALAAQWAYPLAYERPEIEATADRVYLCFADRVVSLARDGGACFEYPAQGKPACALGGHAVVAGKLLIARAAGPADWAVDAVDGAQVSEFAAVPGVDGVRAFFDNGATLLAHRQNALVLCELDRQAKAYAPKADGVQPLNLPPRDFNSWPVGDCGMLYVRSDGLCLYANGKFKPFAFASALRENRDWDAPGWHRRVGNWLAIRRFFDRCVLVDPERMTDLGADVPFAQFPVVCGGMLCGMIESADPAALAFVWYDPAQRRVLQTDTLPKTQLPGFAARDYRHEMSAEVDGVAYHFFAPTRGVEHGFERWLVIQTAQPRQLRVSSFPGSGTLRDLAVAGNRVLLATGDAALAMDRASFDRLQDAAAPVAAIPCQPDFKAEVDGFLDEWPASLLHPAGTNAFAALSTGKDLLLAGVLRGTNLMQRLGTRGLDARVIFRLMPGAAAGLARHAARDYGFEAGADEVAAQGGALAWSMAPTGDACVFELRIPFEKMLRFPAAELPQDPFRAKRGDLAFDVSFCDDDGSVESLLPPRAAAWPAYDWRLRIESPGK